MEFKHSPAPWRCHDKRPNCSGYSIVGNDGQYIGFVGDSDELSPIDANANLIAAAPELLEQLIRLRNKIASYKPDDEDDLDIVDAVIAKALGQQ
ncbi:hypothetical protein U2T78_004318 [Providencia stuartii]|uniref:Uncharacterized protein n=1 Tax=Providencia rettgeri TaxID=587 RepID=A0AAD2VQ68_PRORE|nr:hypothetical protein [Providencia stuartii]ELR5215847.1 hypothetical protein [Providencia rettgeri]ELR5120956.1 hypothetical protein [Providencia stuartii]EMA3643502.1 hypothetical protein [Providencia stuartii]EMF0919353.1 hypothetical protein [Providencia stuartii]MBW3103078.1 hypothetical protein [Providencia stuartii]